MAVYVTFLSRLLKVIGSGFLSLV